MIRARRGAASNVAIPVLAVVAALATAALILIALGANPLTAYRQLVIAAFGGPFEVSETIVKTTPRLVMALGLVFAFRARIWNIGAEGQMYLGATAATAIVMAGLPLPFPMTPLIAIMAGCAAGALWGAIPGVLRARRGISEIITSLMLVYIAIQLTNYLLETRWSAFGSAYPASRLFPAGATLPVLIEGTVFDVGQVIALLLVPLTWFLAEKTTLGLRLRAIGGSHRTAMLAGISLNWTIVGAMMISGAYAGLVGATQVLGVYNKLVENFSPGYGFEAIAVALVGRLHPFGLLGAALVFGALDAGGAGIVTTSHGVPTAIVQIIEALAVIYMMIGMGFWDRFERRRRARSMLSDVA